MCPSQTWDNYDGLAPTDGLNTFTIASILTKAGIAFSDVQMTGCDVIVTYYFDCNWDNAKRDCLPLVREAPHEGADGWARSNSKKERLCSCSVRPAGSVRARQIILTGTVPVPVKVRALYQLQWSAWFAWLWRR